MNTVLSGVVIAPSKLTTTCAASPLRAPNYFLGYPARHTSDRTATQHDVAAMGWGNRSQKQVDPNDPAALLDQLMGSTRNMTETRRPPRDPRGRNRTSARCTWRVAARTRCFTRRRSAPTWHRAQRSTPSPFVRIIRRKNPSEPGTKRRGARASAAQGASDPRRKSMDDKVRSTKEGRARAEGCGGRQGCG